MAWQDGTLATSTDFVTDTSDTTTMFEQEQSGYQSGFQDSSDGLPPSYQSYNFDDGFYDDPSHTFDYVLTSTPQTATSIWEISVGTDGAWTSEVLPS